jgi:hypothetical protein
MEVAERADRQQAVNILTLAFDQNMSVNYVVKPGTKRVDRVKQLMGYSFDYCKEFGEVYKSDNGNAFVLLLYPDRKKPTFKSIIWDIHLTSNVIGVSRIIQVLNRETLIKKNHPKIPFTHLWFIGVDPAQQGKGVGSKLINEVITLNEQKRRPIYLETSVDKNLSWYKNLGFEIYNTLELGYQLHLLRKTF